MGPGEGGKQPHLGDFCWGGRHQLAVGAGDANRGLAVNTGVSMSFSTVELGRVAFPTANILAAVALACHLGRGRGWK